MHLLRKQHEQAAQDLRKTISLEPLFLDVYVALGESLEALGQLEEAKRTYLKVVEIAPESKDAEEAEQALARMETAKSE